MIKREFGEANDLKLALIGRQPNVFLTFFIFFPTLIYNFVNKREDPNRQQKTQVRPKSEDFDKF